MSPYWILWIILCIVTIKDVACASTTRILKCEFYFIFVIMSLLLIWRYGQGSDYFGYYLNYLLIPDDTITFPHYGEVHGEIGWLFICNVFRVLHAPWELFVALVSAMQMWGLFLFMHKYSVEMPFALILSIPSLYFIYFASSLRQGLLIAILLGVLLPLLEEKKYLPFFIITGICITIHSVACVFLLLPLVQWIRKTSVSLALTASAWAAGFLFTNPFFQRLFKTINLGSLQYYLDSAVSNVNFNVMAIAERLLSFTIVSFLYYRMWKLHVCNDCYSYVYRCYLMAVAVYGLLSWNGFIASRTMGVLQFTEIYLIGFALQYLVKKEKYTMLGLLIALNSFMLFKNVNASIYEGEYIKNITAYSYPYVSIFDRGRIYELRELPRGWLRIINKDHPTREIELKLRLAQEKYVIAYNGEKTQNISAP